MVKVLICLISIFCFNICQSKNIDIDSLNNKESINFILYALEESKKLAGGLSKSNQSILDNLEKKISIKNEYETKKRIKDILLKDNAKEKSTKPI